MSTSNYIGGGPPMPPLQSSQQQPDIVSSSLITSQQQQQQPATLDQNLERLFSFSIIETKDDYEEVSRSKVSRYF